MKTGLIIITTTPGQVKEERKEEPKLPTPKTAKKDSFDRNSFPLIESTIKAIETSAPTSGSLVDEVISSIEGNSNNRGLSSGLQEAIDAIEKDKPSKGPRTKLIDDTISSIEKGGDLALIERTMNGLGLAERDEIDGSYSRKDDTGKYFWQPDGSAYYSGGKVKSKDGTEKDFQAGTLVKDKDGNFKWDFTKNTPLPWTSNINGQNLKPTRDGYFISDKFKGRYYLQDDGTMSYTEKHLDEEDRESPDCVLKKVTEPDGTIVEKWVKGDSLPFTKTMIRAMRGNISIRPFNSGTFIFSDRSSGKRTVVYPLSNGKYIVMKDSKVYMYNKTGDEKYGELKGTEKETPEVKRGISVLEQLVK